MRKCCTCKTDKEDKEFSKDIHTKDGLSIRCRLCTTEKNQAVYKRRKAGIVRVVKTKEERKQYYIKWQANRKKNDPLFKFDRGIRKLIYMSFKNQHHKKTSKTVNILGCSMEDFKKHIESKFEYWMNWENYAKYNGNFDFGWELDHIIPLSSAKTEEDIIVLNHYSNFQPLCTKINRYVKSDKIFQ